ncbi:Retrovirus polyprotein [Apostichopus japonicus]|uniref:Retrovirus polyprotein n=1 Tax=Stichopus japonicus TaxID=307972 RepID=A0A2G8JMA6_STIJA|nr:Retrovirus polyprotein [Apostichopus japonicus]
MSALRNLPVTALGQNFYAGFLVTRDLVGTPMAQRKAAVPGLLGSNIFEQLSELLKKSLGESYLQQLLSEGNKWAHVLALYQEKVAGSLGMRREESVSDDTPIKVPHRRIPPHEWQEVREHLEKLLKQKVIQESSSPFASPVVLVRKKDGKLRLCVDYRALNNKTRKDAYPLPRIEEALDALKGAKYFCSLDLSHGYYQVPVAEEDVEKTAFRAGTGGLYEYLRMPFGLCNAPATFMRLMDHIFGDQNMQTLLIYLDDILVFGSTVEETTARLEMVIERLERHNLKLKPSKCQLFRKKVRYLGHVVSSEGISPDPEKIRAVKDWPLPRNEKELRGSWA